MKKQSIIKRIAVFPFIILLLVTLVGWGPQRDTSDYYDTSTYPDYPQFNSTKNHPIWGFTPDFASIKDASSTNWLKDDLVYLIPGSVYDIVAFYQNDAPINTNETINARMNVDFPIVVRGGEETKGTIGIKADNTVPDEIWTTITFTCENDVLLRYVPGSASVFYGGFHDYETKALPNEGKDLFSPEGQLLGYNLDGIVPGEDSAYIQFQIVVDQPGFALTTRYKKTALGDWVDANDFTVSIGDQYWILLIYENTGTTMQSNIVFRNELPLGVDYVRGSTYMKNSNHPYGVSIPDGVVSEGGIEVATAHAPGAVTYVWFMAKVGNVPSVPLNNKAVLRTPDGTITVSDPGKMIALVDPPNMDDPAIYKEIALFLLFLGVGINLVFSILGYFIKECREDKKRNMPIHITKDGIICYGAGRDIADESTQTREARICNEATQESGA